jgi:hypothetical protein
MHRLSTPHGVELISPSIKILEPVLVLTTYITTQWMDLKRTRIARGRRKVNEDLDAPSRFVHKAGSRTSIHTDCVQHTHAE